MEPQFIRAFRAESDGEQTDDGPITFIASSEEQARDGFSIAHDGWDLKNFNRNPIFLWAHDYSQPAIGRVKASIDKDAKALKAEVTFDLSDPFAASVARKYREGFLSAVSVGFDIKEIDGEKVDPMAWIFPKPGSTVTKSELLELSGVPVPADPKALAERAKRGLTHDLSDLLSRLTDVSERGPLRVHTATAIGEPDDLWDSAYTVGCASEMGESTLRAVHAWVALDGDSSAKSSYRFPHHWADGTLVLNGLKEAMRQLHTAEIPDEDRRGVYQHLASHFREFNLEPPPFRSLSEADAEVIWPGTALLMARLYLDMTDDADDDDRLRRYRTLERRYRLLGKEPPEFLSRPQLCLLDDDAIRGLFGSGEDALLGWESGNQRAGAVLSSRNRGDLEKAVALVRGVLERATKEEAEEEARAFLSQLVIDEHAAASDLLTRLAG